MARGARDREEAAHSTHGNPKLLYRAARMYYLDNATQAEVAAALGTSRPTVSRLLAEARASGIVRIEVLDPSRDSSAELADRLKDVLALRDVLLTPDAQGPHAGAVLAPAVARALRIAELSAGDALLVSSGATVYAVAQHELPSLPGVLVAPTVGGVDEPEAYYQTNEITRCVASALHGSPQFLYAPAMPSAALYPVLLQDPLISRVTSLWSRAKAVLLGVGAPPHTRSSVPTWFPRDSSLLDLAVGDLCERPYDVHGLPLPIPGSERLVAMELSALVEVPHSIGVAVGAAKVPSILAAVEAGYVNTLVTDAPTAQMLWEAATSRDGSRRRSP